MGVSMFLPTYLIISTIKASIIIILFTSIFFFQNQSKPKFLPKTFSLGISSNHTFSTLKKNKSYFMSTLKTLAFASLIPLFLNILTNPTKINIAFSNWLTESSFSISTQFLFDLKFKLFFSIALFVSWSILEFSFYYMGKDPAPKNFFRLLIIFLLNMIILTSTNNIFLLFIGWEGVGFLSFLLISWWTTRANAKKSAIQAVIYKRIGDAGMLVFFSLSLTLFKSWNLSEISSIKNSTSFLHYLLLVGALIAATGKSAQFGLHPWLPAAMEGPTPVSALLHRSTMVVAGIFFLVRISPLYKKIPTFKSWCLILGSLTAIFAATTAISQHDIKKIIAYSTTRQLGLMMVAIGLNQPNIALFHICTHAFFKAMLFLSSGRIIHSLKDEQDIRKMGGLHFILPNTSACIILGRLALSGIPFLAGFYSKDLILEIRLSKLSKLFGILLSFLATLLTSVYSVRIIYFCFFKTPTFSPLSPTREEDLKLTKALNRLALGTIIAGWFISSFILINPHITISFLLKNLALFITILGLAFSTSILLSLSKTSLSKLYSPKAFTSNQWFFENLSHSLLLLLSFTSSLALRTRNLDRGWTENLGPQGIGEFSFSLAQKYQDSQRAYIKQYLVFSILSFTLIFSVSFLYNYSR